MIIDFKVENFKSFKNPTEFSMEAGEGLPIGVNTVNIFKNKDWERNILKSSVVFGPNASGKSNFVDILSSLRYYLLEKGKRKFREEDFRFSQDKKNSKIEMNIFLNNSIYRCFMEISFSKGEICSEGLYIISEHGRKKDTGDISREKELMESDMGNKEIKGKNEGEKIEEKEFTGEKVIKVYERDSSGKMYFDSEIFSRHETTINFISESINEWDSLLSRMKEYNSPPEIEAFIEYLENMVIIKAGVSRNLVGKLLYEEGRHKDILIKYLRKLDIKIDDIEVRREKVYLSEEFTKVMDFFTDSITGIRGDESIVYNINFIYRDPKECWEYKLNLSEQSLGTKKILELFVPIYTALSKGSPLIVDELDSSLHYGIVSDILKMFNSVNDNRKNSQLIFTSHNLLLLNSDIFREDQIWLTENEDIYNGTELYSLFDFNDKVDKENILRDYLNGFFGGLPNVQEEGVGRWLEALKIGK